MVLMKNNTKNILYGIVLFGFFVAFFFYVFISKQDYQNKKQLADSYIVKASFYDIEGIKAGSQVRIAGVNVGKVVAISLSNAFKSQVEISIPNNINLPADTAVIVESDGVFGDKYIEILPGADDYFIPHNGFISYAQDTMRISAMLEKFVDYAKNKIIECNACLDNKNLNLELVK